MSIQLKLIAWLLSVCVVAGLLYGCYHYGKHVQALEDGALRDSAVIVQQEKNQADLLAYAETIKKASAQHDENQSVITGLHDDIIRMRVRTPARSVRETASTSSDSDRASRVLSSQTQTAFDEFKSGVGSDYARCDALNIDAIRLNGELR